MTNHSSRVVTAQQIRAIFKSAMPLNVINGIKKCGIYPNYPDICPQTNFIAAQTTDEKAKLNEEPFVPVTI